MKINYNCLPCLINQVVKVSEITGAKDRDQLFKKVFRQLGEIDFSKSNPEIIGMTFRLLKEHTGNNDPYKDIRLYYNKLFSDMSNTLEDKINNALNPFEEAVKYAIIGNIIDFNPIYNHSIDDILKWFKESDKMSLSINHVEKMIFDVQNAKKILYLGDNCGEICLDKLLIKKMKEVNPDLDIYFGVKGNSIVNDSIEEDAYFVGINQYATVISNGDDSLGNILSRTSNEFNEVYQSSDVIISKGQANYESLSEDKHNNIYFLLVAKCEVIARDIGVATKSLICMNKI